jgi:surface antigen
MAQFGVARRVGIFVLALASLTLLVGPQATSLARALPISPSAHSARHRHSHPRRHVRVVRVKIVQGGRGGVGLVDDYPAKWRDAPQDSELDNWKELNRECTSFVAFRLASRAGFNMPFWDNAINWGPRASALGYKVDNTPTIGSVAWTMAHGGHVAWVAEVEGSTVTIEQYNADFHGHYSWEKVPSSRFQYIHFHDLVPESSSTPATAPSTLQGSSPSLQGSSPSLQGSSPVLQGGNGNELQPSPSGPGTGGGGAPSNPPTPEGFVIEDTIYGGTWARTDPDNGTWYPHGSPPPNGAYWYPNGLGVAVSCAESAATYSVVIRGVHETWSWWAHVTDGKWVPTVVFSTVWTDGLPAGLSQC